MQGKPMVCDFAGDRLIGGPVKEGGRWVVRCTACAAIGAFNMPGARVADVIRAVLGYRWRILEGAWVCAKCGASE